ncbi:MAG TPA: phage holin family protein, partial [Terriglobales bacterium]|nr:phage holin family protein [Terriglobales bacterium]
MRLILHWILSAVALMIVAHLVPGFYIRSFGAALIAALVIGLVNATLGFFLKVLTFPFIILTLGLFWFVVNALMLIVASKLVPGFVVTGFVPAFWGA